MYQLYFNDLVWKEDMSFIDKTDRKRIFKVITKKLTTAPLEYGKVLSGPLKSAFSLKVGDYRVVYKVIEKKVKVFVIKIGFRRNSEVYLQAAARLIK